MGPLVKSAQSGVNAELCWTWQVLHALLEDIHLDFRYSSAAQSSRFSIRSIQIDDQLLTSSHPVILAPTLSSPSNLPLVVCRRTLFVSGRRCVACCICPPQTPS